MTLGTPLGGVLKRTAWPMGLPDRAHADAGNVCAVRPTDLRVEWRTAAVGIDAARPRFSWILMPVDNTASDSYQLSCRVIVASAAAAARAGHGDIWDSGERRDAQLSITPDRDLMLAPQTVFHWAVTLRDQHGRASGWSEPRVFVTGIPASQGWRASWIAATADRPVPPGPPPAINTQPPVEPQPLPLFRRDFRIDKPLQQAIVCISGLGQYELRLNGSRCGKGVLNPGWTDYRKTVLYDTFEVSALLRQGANTIGVLLGNGMYNVEKYAGRYTKRVGTFGQPKLILQLKLRFTDGSEEFILSDASWQTRPGPIVLSQAYGGEDFDARREPAGWDQPAPGGGRAAQSTANPTHDSADKWVAALAVSGPGGALRAQNVPPISVARILTPLTVTRPAAGICVYDLGENFSGWPKIVVRGPAGATVKLLPGELLDEHGLVTQRSANAHPGNEVSFSYTLAGNGLETWSPRFTYYGFRYVQVEGAGGAVALVSLQGEFLHADLPQVGSFDCSNPLLVRIHELIRQALLSNTMSVLTDCPQREKLGWLEQTYLNADTVFYNEDAITLYEKLLRDMEDSQLANGMVPELAPEYVAFLNADGSDSIFRDSPEWSAAMVLSPWAAYRYSGDSRILADGYPAMQRYVRYLATRLQDGLLDFGLGDWYDIGPKPPGEAQLTSRQLTGTAVYCQILLTLARIARTVGRDADARHYESDAAAATRTFNARLFNPATGQYDRGSMTANAMPLAIGLVPQHYRATVLANLVADIRAHDNHVTSGDVGFHYVVLALMENGRADVLYDLLTRADPPSYGFQLARGATALTEAWDANPDKSQNHFMLGHAATWLYGGLGGVRIHFDRPGRNHIRIAPQPVAGIEWTCVHYRSVFGEIVSSWRKVGGRLELDVEIPPGITARIELPGRKPLSVGSGRYNFQAGLTR